MSGCGRLVKPNRTFRQAGKVQVLGFKDPSGSHMCGNTSVLRTIGGWGVVTLMRNENRIRRSFAPSHSRKLNFCLLTPWLYRVLHAARYILSSGEL